jgi:hypothetical protein
MISSKKTIAGSVIAGGLIAAGFIASTATAHADTSSVGSVSGSSNAAKFKADMDAHGFYNADGAGAQLAAGQAVCQAISNGERPMSVAIDLTTMTQLPARQAGQFVAFSVRDLCPQYFPQVLADAQS